MTFAVFTIALTVVKFIVFYNAYSDYTVYLNRFITIMVLVFIAFLSLKYRDAKDLLTIERYYYIKRLEEMLQITSQKIKKPLANFMGAMDFVESEKATLNEKELQDIIGLMKSSALELDEFTTELTLFLSELKKNNKYKSRF